MQSRAWQDTRLRKGGKAITNAVVVALTFKPVSETPQPSTRQIRLLLFVAYATAGSMSGRRASTQHLPGQKPSCMTTVPLRCQSSRRFPQPTCHSFMPGVSLQALRSTFKNHPHGTGPRWSPHTKHASKCRTWRVVDWGILKQNLVLRVEGWRREGCCGGGAENATEIFCTKNNGEREQWHHPASVAAEHPGTQAETHIH